MSNNNDLVLNRPVKETIPPTTNQIDVTLNTRTVFETRVRDIAKQYRDNVLFLYTNSAAVLTRDFKGTKGICFVFAIDNHVQEIQFNNIDKLRDIVEKDAENNASDVSEQENEGIKIRKKDDNSTVKVLNGSWRTLAATNLNNAAKDDGVTIREIFPKNNGFIADDATHIYNYFVDAKGDVMRQGVSKALVRTAIQEFDKLRQKVNNGSETKLVKVKINYGFISEGTKLHKAGEIVEVSEKKAIELTSSYQFDLVE